MRELERLDLAGLGPVSCMKLCEDLKVQGARNWKFETEGVEESFNERFA
jgi:hypothetical protein